MQRDVIKSLDWPFRSYKLSEEANFHKQVYFASIPFMFSVIREEPPSW